MFNINIDKIKQEKRTIGYSRIPYYADCVTCLHYNLKSCKKSFIKVNIKLNTKLIIRRICKNWELKPYFIKALKRK